MTPSALGPARRVLKEVFGYDRFRAGQEEAIAAVLGGRHVLAVMPTGAGKSLCYQVPALVNGGLTIVVSPLVALMEDQVAALELAGVAAAAVNSARPPEANSETWRRVRSGDVKLLYLAPERLMTEPTLEALSRLPVRLIAVDEAHCISRWGPAFRPEYEALGRLGALFPEVPIVALTATADAVTREDIAARLFGGPARTIVTGFDRPNIRLAVELRRDWRGQLLGFLEGHRGESGIVYCLSRDKTERTAGFLAAKGHDALPYHAGMDAAARKANQDRFMREPGVVMVSTIAFGMGIDKPDIRFVFHTDLPGNVEAYYQEIGRAGRDGKPADAFMLYGFDDLRTRRKFIEQDGGDEAHRRREHTRLNALVAYCEAPECRRRALLAYFGEEPAACGNCDVCMDPPEVADGTTYGRMALSAAYRTGQRFGAGHLIDVLRGADTTKVREKGHDRLPTYGVGSEVPKEEWASILRQLVAAGHLWIDIAGHGGLAITDKGKELLRGNDTFRYRRDRVVRPRERSARPAIEAAPEDAGLLAALKALRLELARERDVPAYMIFSDRSLADMAARRPASREAFHAVHGVGKAKLEEFAEAFLAVIREHAEAVP